MTLKENIIKIWKNKGHIYEGIRNSIFKKEDVEDIANERLLICRSNLCGFYDPLGTSEAAVVKGAESCGNCGCKLSYKTRALSSECPIGLWSSVLTETEESHLKKSSVLRMKTKTLMTVGNKIKLQLVKSVTSSVTGHDKPGNNVKQSSKTRETRVLSWVNKDAIVRVEPYFDHNDRRIPGRSIIFDRYTQQFYATWHPVEDIMIILEDTARVEVVGFRNSTTHGNHIQTRQSSVCINR
jgi:hypothetical protein